MALQIQVERRRENIVAVSLAGSLDSDTYAQLQKEFKPILSGNIKGLILNMKELNYISSIGIAVILSVKKTLQERNGIFTMVDLQPQIKLVFDTVKALPEVPIFESIEEADRYFTEIQRRESERQK